MNIAITGASGYLGSRLSYELRTAGHQVYALVRSPSKKLDIQFLLQNVSQCKNIFPQLNLNVLIHCAWDMSLKNPSNSHEINVINSINLFKIAKEAGDIKIIFISSMSAFNGCISTYGKQKLEVEKIVLAMGGIVLRPGIIWGADCTGGMFHTLTNLVDKLPVVPMIGTGNNTLHLSHVADLADLVCKIVANIPQVNYCLITAASSRPMSLREILRQCANLKKKSTILMPIPATIILFILKLMEIFRVPIRMRSDSVIGFVNADKKPIFDQEIFKKIGFLGFREF